jgi:hypothetical protein
MPNPAVYILGKAARGLCHVRGNDAGRTDKALFPPKVADVDYAELGIVSKLEAQSQ